MDEYMPASNNRPVASRLALKTQELACTDPPAQTRMLRKHRISDPSVGPGGFLPRSALLSLTIAPARPLIRVCGTSGSRGRTAPCITLHRMAPQIALQCNNAVNSCRPTVLCSTVQQ